MSHILNQVFISLISVAVILGFMVLIHEFGHYAVAKLLGVRVEQFAIGFGNRLFGFKKGDTDYRVNALPFGGYVKMSGENPMDEHTGDPAEFMSHPRWHRFLIAIAGPAMNILLAIVLLAGIYTVHYEYPPYKDEPAVIGYVKADSPAAKIGAQRGDRIVQIDGVSDPTWEDVEMKELLSANESLPYTIQRGTQKIQGTIVPAAVTNDNAGSSGWYADEPVVLGTLEPNMPAQKIGLKPGDKILTLDGQPVPSIKAMIDRLQQIKSKPVHLEVDRNGQTLSFDVAPVLADTPDNEKHYRLGFSPQAKIGRLPLSEAFKQSLEVNRRYSLLLLQLVGKLVQRHSLDSLRAVSGPIGIAQQAGAAAQEKGWIPLLVLTVIISLNLGIFNLLPIPIMDGGVILLLFIESIMRRDISLNIKERIYQAAFVFLILFAAMVVYNDIVKTIGPRLP
jgi:regulator of sigma E protease